MSSSLPRQLLNAPFTLADAQVLGVSRRVLSGSRFRRLFRNVYVYAELPSAPALLASGAALAAPKSAAAYGWTAALLWELPLPVVGRPAHRVRRLLADGSHVQVPEGVVVPRQSGLVGHVGLREADVESVDGLRVVSGSRTFCDVAADVQLVDLVAFGDAAVRSRAASLTSLRTAVASFDGHRGVVRAREALALVRMGVDSPMESRARIELVMGGLPEPEINQDLVVDGAWLMRPDLMYRRYRLALEFDGDIHRTNRRQWRDDTYRKELADDAGWRVLVLTADDVLVKSALMVHRVREQLMARGWNPTR